MRVIGDSEHLAQTVHNNASWCDVVCRAHGAPGEFRDDIWLNHHPTPSFYPNAVTLTGARGSGAQLAAIRELTSERLAGSWAVKDSYCTLDLEPLGFRVLFEATWLWRAAGAALPAAVDMPGVRWEQVTQPADLADWEAAWRGPAVDETSAAPARIFLPALLADPTITFLAAYHDQRIVAGAIANCTGDVVGASNVFTPVGQAERFWAGYVGVLARMYPDLPLVGYEQGDELAIARHLGFEPLGLLRVWSC